MSKLLFLIITILALVFTLGMYIYRAVKQVKYKNDERWKNVLLHATRIAEISNWGLIIAIFICMIIPSIQEYPIMLKRVALLGLLYFGLHNLMEWVGIIYFDHKL